MPTVRVYDRISRQLQRLGYIKRMIQRVVSSTTSNLDNLGNDLIDAVTRKIKVPLNEERAIYIKIRLYDRVYKALKYQTDEWLKDKGVPPQVSMEIQDLYLADQLLPSQVGKLVREDWRIYPQFGINLGFIREGTYSANTRALSLRHFTSENEDRAFLEYIPETNPLLISKKQSLLFLYSMIENDGEIVAPLWVMLGSELEKKLNDREIGDYLPDIYRTVINRHRNKMLSIDIRNRLDSLEKSANSIAAQRDKERYAGGTAREHASRPRIEPYVDLGLFMKPNPMKYEYTVSQVGSRWMTAFRGQEDSAAIQEFLATRFFQTAAFAWEISARPITDSEEMLYYLRHAAQAISSSSGYTPIEELGLVAGIEALIDDHCLLEISTAREALIAFQKANPYKVRFTVDRLGLLAHVKFMDMSDT